MTMADELQKLQDLRTQGALTEEEFQQAKKRVLDELYGAGSPSGAQAGAQSGPQTGAQANPSPRDAGPASTLKALQRSNADRWIGGVCGGLAETSHIPSWAWRILFVLATPLHGLGVLVYLFLWIFVPLRKVYSPNGA
jgi:phage shock protein PspC (stress-responsive transcriptional regulator)